MKIAILNQPTGNRGDEAAHKAFVRRLANALPNCQIDVIFIMHDQERIEAFNVHLPNVGYVNIKSLSFGYGKAIHWGYRLNMLLLSYLHPLLWKFRKYLKKYDKVICAPGGMCMGGFKVWAHIYNLETAKRLHKPIYYWGRSIGPFREDDMDSKVFKTNSINLLKYFSYISLRDSISIKYANELGIMADEVVDSAFLECPNTIVPENIIGEIDGSEYIVYVPNELTWHPHYPKALQSKIDSFFLKIIDLISDKFPNRKIVMLPQTYKSAFNDYAYFKRLSMHSENNNIIVIDENQNSDIQQKIIAGSKLVIGARYHSIVFAINNNVPFISLSYEHKMEGLLERLSMTEYMVEIQDIFDDGNEKAYKSAIEKIKILISHNCNSVNKYEAVNIVNGGFEMMIKSLIKN